MAAPKGSQYAVGYGRPPKFEETPEELIRMDSLIFDYFNWIQGEFDEELKEFTRRPEPPTITGLTFHLGFCNKSTLYDYAKNEYFSNLIKRAMTLVEKHHEINVAHGDKCTGNIFVLKNMGWKDVQHNENENRNYDLPISKEEIELAKEKFSGL